MRIHLAWYGLVVFLSSAIIMVLELSAGRLLAPYLGVSLYTWTSIIGVVLAGLSLGSYLGGLWADAGASEKSAGVVIALAGVFALCSLWLLGLTAPIVQNSEMTLLGASFIYMLVLFFVPATLLGIVMPLLTTLALKLDTRTGHVVGRMHALGALGSILGTFLTGFWLVQTFGTRTTLISCGFLLIALATPFLLSRSVAVLTVFLSATGVYFIQDKIPTPCDIESNYFCLRAVDASDQAPFGTARAMVLDHLLHGVNHQSNPEMLISPYLHLMDEIPRIQFDETRQQTLNYFFAGGGAYTQPRAIKHNSPHAKIVVAEIDPAVTKLAEDQLFLNTDGMEILHEDARIALNRFDDDYFDVVVADVFHDISVPYHLLTKEFIETITSKLSPDGLFMANLVDIFPNPRLVKAFINTLHTRFKYVDIWLDKLPNEPTRMTYVVVANNTNEMPKQLEAKKGLDAEWFNVTEPLLKTGDKLTDLPVLSDDFVPVEKLISSLLLSQHGN